MILSPAFMPIFSEGPSGITLMTTIVSFLIENSNENIEKFKPLLKLYDRADIINDIA